MRDEKHVGFQLEDWQIEERKYFVSLISESFHNLHRITILDLCCGQGRDLKLFESWGLSGVGTDISKDVLEIACHQCYSLVLKSDMREIPFLDNYFTGVWACNCINHILESEVGMVFGEVFRVLKNDGVFFVSTNHLFPELEGSFIAHGFSILKSEKRRWKNPQSGIKRHSAMFFARKEESSL